MTFGARLYQLATEEMQSSTNVFVFTAVDDNTIMFSLDLSSIIELTIDDTHIHYCTVTFMTPDIQKTGTDKKPAVPEIRYITHDAIWPFKQRYEELRRAAEEYGIS